MKLTIAHSPDSDDAYMMAPLALGWMDPEGFEIEFIRKDIEQLNAEATEGRHDVTAISFGAYPELRDLLTAGSSIQEGTGPLVVSRTPLDVPTLKALTIAIPGRRTSAYLSMRKWCAEQGFEPAVELLPFDQILPAVVEGRFEAGLLIHESQLMYHDAGLRLVVDLGAWWKQHFATLMRRSVELARARHWESVDYSQSFGRGMDREMIGRYVNAWVNDFTVDPGPRGRRAVQLLLGLEPVWIQG